MDDVHDLVEQARRVGRIPSRNEALRWLRAVASILTDWGGARAQAVLRAELPRELFRGGGSSGRSRERASAESGAGLLALLEEAALRARQPDPGKIGVTLEPLLHLLKSRLPHGRAEEVGADLPAAVARAWREADGVPPWAFRLIPQSYRGGIRRDSSVTFPAPLAPDEP